MKGKELAGYMNKQQEMYGAIVTVTKEDPKLVKPGRYARFAKSLLENDYTPEQVLSLYSDGGWWYANDWRGKQGEAPTEIGIRQTIAIAAKESGQDSLITTEDGGVYF